MEKDAVIDIGSSWVHSKHGAGCVMIAPYLFLDFYAENRGYDVVRGDRVIQSFNSRKAAQNFISCKLPKGKVLVKRIKCNDLKVKKLLKEVAKLESASFLLMERLENGDL